MAEDSARSRQYAYVQNSNLVLQADRDSKRNADEPTGEVESLAGKIKYRMGDKAEKAQAPPSSAKRKRKTDKPEEQGEQALKKKMKQLSRADADASGDGGGMLLQTGGLASARSNILQESSTFESKTYAPTNPQSRDAYDQLLSVVTKHVGDQPGDLLAGVAEEVLSILKSDGFRDDQRYEEVGSLLKGITTDEFSDVVALGRRITDFRSDMGEEKQEDEAGQDLDKEVGVAVVFDEEEEEESDLEEVHEEEVQDSEEEEPTDHQMRLNDEEEEKEEQSSKFQLKPQDIDAFWLQRELSKYYTDADVSARLSEDILTALKDCGGDLGACENALVLLLEYDKFDLIKLLLENRGKVLYCTRLKQAQNDEERRAIELEMAQDESLQGEGEAILKELSTTSSADSWMADRMGRRETTSRAEAKRLREQQQQEQKEEEEEESQTKPSRYIDVEALIFEDGGHVMSNKECRLPEGTWRAQKKGYEEVHVPAVRTRIAASEEANRIRIDDMPEWTHDAFKGMDRLNRVQSRMFPASFKSSENLLLCAPTGAGKTNVAMLTILHELSKYRDEATGEVDLQKFKIVYVAPMKALVQEVVLNLGQRLAAYGIQVKELSGDQSLSREQLTATQVIVTTPEKWDVVTRKPGDDRAYTQLVRLIIIDEIHLLHDTRGPVLEALVSRTIRQIESSQQNVRLVGLSATLPNYEDVAAFLRVDKDKGLFFFDSSYRPVPLQQQYIGVMEKKPVKRLRLMNEICFDKVREQCTQDNQVLIFVHSRKETLSTAQALRDMFVENDAMQELLPERSASREILREESEKLEGSEDLKEILQTGFGIHHAGMKRSERQLVEDAFADGHLRVLVSTSTLAWGVNLPAHTVIIKGTQMYSAEKGGWTELSPLDILQMLGRAGRVQYDTQGEGIILTQHAQLTYYLSLMNQQLPVESQLLSRLADSLNAEIALGTVQSLSQAAVWLGYTYFFVRVLRNPSLYGASVADKKQDPSLLQYRTDLAHSAMTLLAKHSLVKYERRSGRVQSTSLGRVASHYYVAHQSVATYNQLLKPHLSDIELLRVFSLSHEFRHVMVRSEEKLELAKLMDRVPVPVKETLDGNSGAAKVNVLLQAYISRLKLDGFALAADMAHIHQSAARIFRALFEMCLQRQWAALAQRLLNMCKMVDRRIWFSHSPLRQLASSIPDQALRRIEKKDLPFDKYLELEPPDLGQLVSNSKWGKQLYKAVHQFPKLLVECHVEPITRGLLRVELTIEPDFDFVRDVHGNSEGFWCLVTDVDESTILHYEFVLLRRRLAQDETVVVFTMPLTEPLAPLCYLRLVSDKWLHAETTIPVSFHNMILPAKNAPPTELLDLQPIFVNNLLLKICSGRKTDAQKLKASMTRTRVSPWTFDKLNPIQTQVLPRVLDSDSSLLVCAPPGSGKSVLLEVALMKTLTALGQPDVNSDAFGDHLIVYLNSQEKVLDFRFRDWQAKFGDDSYWMQNVEKLTGDQSADVRALSQANILLATPAQFDVLSRRWKQRRRLQTIRLALVEEVQFLGSGQVGPTLEVVLSRLRFIAANKQEKENRTRIVAVGTSVANAKDVGDWLGAPSDNVFGFHPSVRPEPLEVRVQGFDVHDFSARMLAMSKPAFNFLSSEVVSSILFTPSSKQAQLSAIDLVTFALAENDPDKFRPLKAGEVQVDDPALQQTMERGVGYVTEAMTSTEVEEVVQAFRSGNLTTLVVPRLLAWSLAPAQIKCDSVLLLGAQFFDGKERRYVDYPLSDVLRMTKFGRSRCMLLCHSAKKSFYAKFLYDPLPVESNLRAALPDHMNAEVVTRTIESKQEAVDYLTWTFLYRRLLKNPNFYNMEGATTDHVSDYLSDLVEQTIGALEVSRCVQVDDEEDGLAPLNLGMIAAYYYIQYTTVEAFARSLSEDAKLPRLLLILCESSEFAVLPSRFGEDRKLETMAKHLKLQVPNADYTQPSTKAHVLLQMHFSRQHDRLNAFLRQDLDVLLGSSVKLVHAMVDVISSNGWLKPALAAMDLAQMLVQGVWSSDSPLKQIPFFTQDVLDRVKELGLQEDVEVPVDILSLEDDVREKLLPFENKKLSAVAEFCNAFPDVNIETQVENDGKDIPAGSSVTVVVQLEREAEDEEQVGMVKSAMFPTEKAENWWVVVGNAAKNTLLNVKRVPFGKKSVQVKLELAAPKDVGEYTFQLYGICDGYAGCDLENEIKLHVVEAQDTSEDEEME